MSGKETFLIETLSRELIVRLMDERGVTMRQAMDTMYKSRTYAALSNPQTGLCYQSPAYVFDELDNELRFGIK